MALTVDDFKPVQKGHPFPVVAGEAPCPVIKVRYYVDGQKYGLITYDTWQNRDALAHIAAELGVQLEIIAMQLDEELVPPMVLAFDQPA